MVKQIQSEIIDISLLKKADYNPRTIDENTFKLLKDEIQEIGFLDPIIINMHEGREYTIIGGHQRYEAL